MRPCAQTRAIQRSAALDCRLRAPVAGAGRDLLLPKPLTDAILASKPRASGEYRLVYLGVVGGGQRAVCSSRPWSGIAMMCDPPDGAVRARGLLGGGAP